MDLCRAVPSPPPRIHGELLKLGIDICQTSVAMRRRKIALTRIKQCESLMLEASLQVVIDSGLKSDVFFHAFVHDLAKRSGCHK